MRYLLLTLIGLSCSLQAMEYQIQFENEELRVSKWKLMPGEGVGLHRDEYPAAVYALQGGTIRRLEADGSTTDVTFPTGVVIKRDVDPLEELHSSLNKSDHPIEALMVEFKSK